MENLLHAIIIDDEENGVNVLQQLIYKYIEGVKIIATSTNPKEGIELINNYRPDIVFLDISMPDIDGFQLLKQLTYRSFYLIFTTAHNDRGIEAIKQQATDYLLKPICKDELKDAIDKIIARKSKSKEIPEIKEWLLNLPNQHNNKIALPTKLSIDYVAFNEVVYIKGESNHAEIKLYNGEYHRVNRSLKEYEEQLCHMESQFIRIHNSYIINLDYATKYLKESGGFVVMKHQKTIPISKGKKDEFLKRINYC